MLCTRTQKNTSKLRHPRERECFSRINEKYSSPPNIDWSIHRQGRQTYDLICSVWDVCLCWFPHSWNIADPCLENQPKWTDVPVLMDIQPRHMCQPLCSNMSNKKRGSWRKHVEKPYDAIPSSNEGKHLVTGKKSTSTCTRFCTKQARQRYHLF